MIKSLKNYISSPQSSFMNTFLVAFFIALTIVTGATISARYSIEDELYLTKEHKSKIKRKFTETILSKEDLLSKIYSNDYRFNIYMGDLNKSVYHYERAEFYYKRAIALAPDATFEHYLKLIDLYLKMNQPQKAEDIHNAIENNSNQYLIKFKCDAHILIADYYYKNNSPEKSLQNFEQANFYFDKLIKRVVKVRKYIDNGILSTLVKIADNYVSQKDYLSAYRYLREAEKNEPANLVVKYKLALVLSHIDPIQAIKYFDHVKIYKPQLISFYLYYETLMRAAEICTTKGELPEAKLYTYKAGSVKNFYSNNIVNSDIIDFNFVQAKVKTQQKSDRFSLKFRIKNTTTYSLSNVRTDIIFYKSGKPWAKFNQTLFTSKDGLKPGQTSPIINVIFDAPAHYKKNVYEDISFEIYVYKNDKYKSLIYQGDFAEAHVTEF